MEDYTEIMLKADQTKVADKRETSGFRALDHSINPYNYITDDQVGSAVKEFFKQN